MKFNKNSFPHEIHRFLKDHPGSAFEKKSPLIMQHLKSWYQSTFQKNNRWNRTQIYRYIKDYSDQEIEKLKECFELLFNTNNQYHQVFIRYLKEYQEQKEIAKSTMGFVGLKVDQNTFEEIINYFGDLKGADKIENTNKQIARILKLIFNPDKPLEETTIVDRLMNKKGYY